MVPAMRGCWGYQLVKCEYEINQEILAFSDSRDNNGVTSCGYYPIVSKVNSLA